MGGSLSLANPVGLHFFEPRYRALIAEAMANDKRFVFSQSRPRVGDTVIRAGTTPWCGSAAAGALVSADVM